MDLPKNASVFGLSSARSKVICAYQPISNAKLRPSQKLYRNWYKDHYDIGICLADAADEHKLHFYPSPEQYSFAGSLLAMVRTANNYIFMKYRYDAYAYISPDFVEQKYPALL